MNCFDDVKIDIEVKNNQFDLEGGFIMQRLNFLGVGSGLSDSHNNCWFIREGMHHNENDVNGLFFIDMSMLNVGKAMEIIKNNLDKKVSLLVTHTHPDHVSGIGMLLQKCYYQYGITVRIVVPDKLKHPLMTMLTIQGIPRTLESGRDMYEVYGADTNSCKFQSSSFLKLGIEAFATPHAPELSYNYGYIIFLGLKEGYILYSGDTNTLSRLEEYLLENKSNTQVYVDMSFSYGKDKKKEDRVHSLFDDSIDEIYEIARYDYTTNLYLMHIDDMEAARAGIRKCRKDGYKNIYLAKTK